MVMTFFASSIIITHKQIFEIFTLQAGQLKKNKSIDSR